MSLLGFLGALLLGGCALPQAIQSYRRKSSAGLSGWFLAMWACGEILTATYVLGTSADWYLMLNYAINLACLAVILFYK